MAHTIRVKSEILIALNRQEENHDFLKEQLHQSFNSDVISYIAIELILFISSLKFS